MKYADLHIHTKFSDGAYAPERIVEEAHARGLACIAITDHDEVAGITPAKKAAQALNLEVIPGVELSAEIGETEVHILGYFIDWQAQWFQDKLKQLCQVRKERALAIIEKLKQHGIELTADELLSGTDLYSIGRLHIARLLTKKGFVHSTQEAFHKYLGNGRSCYVKKFKLTPTEAIGMIVTLKGVAVLAHPYNIGSDERIAEFVQQGLRGIEVYYPEHDPANTTHYRNLAQKYGLLLTGGSDYHGLAEVGVTLGEVKIPYSLVEALKQEAKVFPNEGN